MTPIGSAAVIGAKVLSPRASQRSSVVVGLLAATVLLASCTGASPAQTGSPGQTVPASLMSPASPSAAASPTADASPAVTPATTQVAPSTTPSAPAPTEPVGVLAVQLPPDLAAITVTDSLRVRSQPAVSDRSIVYGHLPKGTRFRVVEGPVSGSGYWWYRVADLSITLRGGIREGWVASADHDGTPWIGPSPEACLDFEFPAAAVTIRSLAELQAGFQGTWAGCVTTPWEPPYWVTITFRDDGTYSGASQADQLGNWQPAFYYGTDEDSPAKRYELNDLQDSLKGIGQIDIVFSTDSTNRGELRNIKLMGDQLEFEFFHRGEYGPLTYRLDRFDAPG
jgi:hypothetical protein